MPHAIAHIKFRSSAILALLVALPSAGCARIPEGDRPLELVVTGDTNGWIAPCGCTSNQSGGLARRASYIAGRRQQADVVVADVGGAASGTSPYDQLKFAAILHGEVAMGIAAHNLGAAEVTLGADTLRRLARETAAPLVSANLRDAFDRPIVEPLRIVKGSRRIALVGVVSQRFSTDTLHIGEPRAAAAAALEAARGKYDLAIVLAYLPEDELRELARGLPEADVIVGGPTGQSVPPEHLGPVLVAAVTNKGKFAAHLTAPSAKSAEHWQGEIVELDAALADDSIQIANLDRFRRDLEVRDFSADETSFASWAPAGAAPEFQVAGTAACRQCHAIDCRDWAESAHAGAWQTLSASKSQSDCYCQQCHTTAYGLPQGFASARRSPALVDVGCESCHGPSAAHARTPTVHTPFAASDQCLRCHDRENSPEFVYDTFWPRVEHGHPAEDTLRLRAEKTIEVVQ